MTTFRPNRKEFLGASAAALAGLGLGSNVLASSADNPVTIENSKPGTYDWWSWDPALNAEIEGYANKTSVAAGQSISFFINTTSSRYTVEVMRLGWYDGAGARRFTSPVSCKGTRQAIPAPITGTGMVECRWRSPYTITLPTGSQTWTSGIYIAQLTTREGKQSHIPFVVRDDSRYANYLVQASVTTWQAYNGWGGKSLYSFNSSNSEPASKVSFNRPYEGYGSGDLINDWSGWELNTLRFLEREGYDVAYCSNLDTHANPQLLNRCRAFLSVGHDEYWSHAMRGNIEAGRSVGKHLAFLGANDCYWQVRFENGFNGDAHRTMVCYKDAFADPVYQNPATRHLTTVTWRDPVLARPEETLIGTQYEHYPVNADMVVTNTNHWAFDGTGLSDGDRLPGLVGYEADRVFGLGPAGTVILSSSPVVSESGPGDSNMTVYQHDSGAVVFATGSMQWAWGLDDQFVGWRHPYLVHPAAQQITRNVLDRFSW